MTYNNPVVYIPCPERPSSVSVTNAEVLLDGGVWDSMAYDGWSWFGNWLLITFTGPSLSNGRVYFMRMNLTSA